MSGAIEPRLVARLAALAVVMGIFQVAFVSQIAVAGGVADVAPLVVMAVALLTGALPGACFGFALGLFVDAALLQTLGLSSLILTGVGYAIGRQGEAREVDGALVPLAAGAAATLVALVGYALAQYLLDLGAPISGVLLRQTLATLLLNALLAVPVYSLVRRWLRPVLPAEPRRRRRRAPATGAVSPLQRA